MFGPRQFIGKEADLVDEAGHRAFSCLTKAVTLLLKVERNDVAITALWSTVHGLAHLTLDQQLGKMMGKGTIDRCEKMADNVIETLLCGLSSKPAKQTKIQK